MKKLSKIEESRWTDIQDRSSGDEVREEDKGITLVIDGVKYQLLKDFWGLGDVYEEENSDPWRCFAFNRPENSPTVIWGDTEIAGVFGCDKWDIGEDEYDVYVLRDYIDKDRDDYIDELIENGNFEQMYSSELEIQDILVKYTKKIFEDNHMSDFAKYTIYNLIGEDWDCGQAIYFEDDGTWYDDNGKPTIPPCELEDVDYNTVQDIHIISYPMLDNWYEDLRKELIDTYTKLGWVHLKEFELDYENNPSDTEGVAFIKFKDGYTLSESRWSDIQDRSAGEVIRDEDKFNPDYVDFGENTTVYWAIDNLQIDGKAKFSFDEVKDYNNNGWRLPTLEEVNQINWSNIRTPWYDHCTHLEFPDGNELRLKREGNNGFHMWASDYDKKYPTRAQSYGFDNMDKFNTDSFNINWNTLYVFLVKDKKPVNESIWTDIQKRSSGEEEREEDIISNIFKYLDSTYTIVSPKFSSDKMKLTENGICISIFKCLILGAYATICINNKNYINFSCINPNKYEGFAVKKLINKVKDPLNNLCAKINSRYSTEVSEFDGIDHWYDIKVKPEDGKTITKQFCEEFIDFILNDWMLRTPDILKIIKKTHITNESRWIDIQKRSSGEEIRKEDDLTNIKDIQPVDMGVSVLWADRDLELKDGNCYFNYNEAEDSIKKSEWRLPTKEEVGELNKFTKVTKVTDEVCIIEGDFDDKPQLIFNKKGYQYGISDNIIRDQMYCSWTSTPATTPEAYIILNIYMVVSYVPMHYGNRMCVRLVKDRN